MLSLCLMLWCEVNCQKAPTLTAVGPGKVTSDEISGSSLPMSVSSCITSFLPLVCSRDRPHFTAQHNVVKDSAENSWVFFVVVVMIILNQFFPLALSQLTIGLLLKKVNRNLQVPAKVWDLIRHWWEMLIATENPKLEDSDNSAVIIRLAQNSVVGAWGKIITR